MSDAPLPAEAPSANLGQQDALQGFVDWLVANGVSGIGGDDGNVGIYQEANGERGIVCLKVCRPVACQQLAS